MAPGLPSVAPLLVPPHVLYPTEIEDVVVGDHVLHVRPGREVVEPDVQCRPGRVRLELLLDGDDLRETLRRIQLHRLLIDHLHHPLVAISAIPIMILKGERNMNPPDRDYAQPLM